MTMDLQEAFDRGFEYVKRYVDGELAAVNARLAKLEGRSTAEVERELTEVLKREMERP